jgi:hypothetical protein
MTELVTETMGYGKFYLQDLALGKKILSILEEYYANHAWFVDVNHEAGHASIQLMYEGKNKEQRIWKYGFLMHINKIEMGTLNKKIMMAAGEILERYNMARRSLRENDMLDFMTKEIITENMVM